MSEKTTYKSVYGTFDKLTKLNYISWKSNVTTVLQSLRSFRIVLGEELEPAPGVTAISRAAHDLYLTKFAQARTILRFSCGEEIRESVENIDDPAEIWRVLREEFDSAASQIGRNSLSRNFHILAPAPKETIQDYCKRLIRYRHPLQGSNEQISDQVVINHIFT